MKRQSFVIWVLREEQGLVCRILVNALENQTMEERRRHQDWTEE
jgi:hypothetical protein